MEGSEAADFIISARTVEETITYKKRRRRRHAAHGDNDFHYRTMTIEAPMTMTTSITAERTQWADRISAAWQKSVDSIIETGRLLIAAKAGMQHGEWGIMVESDLPFNRQTAPLLSG
jgi:hypothetical protein